MATQLLPLSPPPFDQNMYSGGAMSTSWRTWFSQLWTYAKGPFTSVTAGNAQGVMNTTYFADDVGTVSITLPTSFNVGDEFRVVGVGAGGWEILQNTGQTIHSPTGSTTTSTGTISSTNRYDGVTLVGIVKDSDLSVMYSVGTLTFS